MTELTPCGSIRTFNHRMPMVLGPLRFIRTFHLRKPNVLESFRSIRTFHLIFARQGYKAHFVPYAHFIFARQGTRSTSFDPCKQSRSIRTFHLRKLRLLSPFRSIRTHVRMERSRLSSWLAMKAKDVLLNNTTICKTVRWISLFFPSSFFVISGQTNVPADEQVELIENTKRHS